MQPSGPVCRSSNRKPEPISIGAKPGGTRRPAGESPRDGAPPQLADPSRAPYRSRGKRGHTVLPVRTELWPARFWHITAGYLNRPAKKTWRFYVNNYQNDIFCQNVCGIIGPWVWHSFRYVLLYRSLHSVLLTSISVRSRYIYVAGLHCSLFCEVFCVFLFLLLTGSVKILTGVTAIEVPDVLISLILYPWKIWLVVS